MTRKLSLVFGILLAAGAFLGVLLLGNAVNPSPYQVVVAITEIEPGTVLDKQFFGIDPQVVSPQVAGEYVLANELDEYVGATIVRSLVPGQPLMHRDIVAAGNPAAQDRIALALADPDMTAMVVPVQKTTVPDEVKPGDRIAIVWSIGEANMLTGPSGWNMPEAIPVDATPVAVSPEGEEENEESAVQGSDQVVELPTELEGLPPDVAALLNHPAIVGAEEGPEVEVSLPLAKTVLNVAQVLSVRRDKEPNPAYTGEEGEKPYIEGDITALEVALPHDEIEAVQFAIAQGEYSIVVLSPNADPKALADASSLGVMWSDIMDYFKADRLRAMGALTLTEPVRPAGATSLYGPALRALAESTSASSSIIVTDTTETEDAETEEIAPTTDVTTDVTEPNVEAEETPAPTSEAVSTPTPAGPLSTATSVAEAETTPEATPATGAGPGSGLPVSGTGLVLGIVAVVVVLVLAVLVVGFVIRALRKKAAQN